MGPTLPTSPWQARLVEPAAEPAESPGAGTGSRQPHQLGHRLIADGNKSSDALTDCVKCRVIDSDLHPVISVLASTNYI